MIPVFEPFVGEDEVEAVAAAIRASEISGSFGTNISAFEREFADYIGVRHGVAVTSGTTALQLAVAAAGVEPGDEILISSSTNVATALAAYHNGAIAVPVDSEAATWNLDLDLIPELVTERTRAIIPVHLFGHPVDMDRLMQIADEHGLLVIEDCAQSHGASVRGRMTGSFGLMGCFSFYANKVITTGEGGMVVTNDDELAERLHLLRNLAFEEPRFIHREAGFNFRMTGYQAAMGRVQLSKIDFIIEEKRRVARTYNSLLADLPGIRLPAERDWAINIYWMYAITLEPPFPLGRQELTDRLRQQGVESRSFFFPMNRQPFLLEQPGFRPIDCPVAERLWETGLYLPSSITLQDDAIERVVEQIHAAAESPG